MQFYNKEQMRINYKILKNHYGSHKAVAEKLGISHDHYRKVRNKRTTMSLQLRKLITLSAEKIINNIIP